MYAVITNKNNKTQQRSKRLRNLGDVKYTAFAEDLDEINSDKYLTRWKSTIFLKVPRRPSFDKSMLAQASGDAEDIDIVGINCYRNLMNITPLVITDLHHVVCSW